MQIKGASLFMVLLAGLALAGCGDEATPDEAAGTVNSPPLIAGSPATQISVGTAYSFTPAASDPDGDTLSFSAEGLPGWLKIDATTGRISGTPTMSNVGTTEPITIDAFDQHSHSELDPFRLTVISPDAPPPPPVNTAPTISGTPGTTATIGKVYTFTPTADDAEDDSLSFEITNKPSWATFTAATGRLSGTPPAGSEGTTSGVVISVSDGSLSAALAPFSITVGSTAPANRAPTLTGTPATTATVGVAYSFRPVASDPDGDTLTFTIQNKPSWASFSATTGRLSGTPTAASVGTSARITISVTDQTATASLASFTIQVAAAPNRAPTISGTPATSVAAGSQYTFQPTASDPEGATLTYSVQNKPGWASFSTTTGRLSGTPTTTQTGAYNGIVIGVTDGTNLVTLPSFNITVSGGSTANRAPVISGTPATSVSVDSAYSFTPTASDPDGNALTFSITNKPSWATFSTSTGKLTGTPTSANVGVTTGVVITVSDGTASASLAAFNITVAAVAANGSATLTWVPPLTNSDGSLLTNLAGYRVQYGKSQTSLDQVKEIANPLTLTTTVGNLTSGTWYFAVRAYSTAGSVSDVSNVAQKVVP
jgi:Putative Ig domain